MVHKIINNRFRIFVESFLITLVIFITGVSIGFYVENYRTSEIVEGYKLNEIRALDLKLQNYYYQIMDRGACESAIEQNFIFADQIYDEGLRLEQFEEANQVTDEILIEKKRYVLLKTELWINSILLKQKCNGDFDTVVYLYSNEPTNTFIVAQQKMISNILKDLKEEHGNKIILLPIAGDLKLNIINLQMEIYGVPSLPSIIINERYVLEGFHNQEELERYIG
jgi:hypothetical protein|tara:strand:- start:1315 stop:1986 length:672 start_codon:yes stop_codon:yes gene_type:complete